MGAGLRPEAKAEDEPPDPTVRAPALDPTEPRDDIHQGLCNLAEILITYRFLVLYGLV